MKAAVLIALLAFISLATAGTLVTQLPLYEVRYGPGGVIRKLTYDPSSFSEEVDVHIRTVYSYYLGGCQLWYATHIQDSYGFLYIHQYRNYWGTFYAISRYGTPS